MKRSNWFIAVSVVVLGLVATAFALTDADKATLQKIDDVLLKVVGYEWGMSRESLTQFTDVEREAYESPELLKAIEGRLIKALESGRATLPAKQFICRRLSIIGTADAVPVLAQMLPVEETADMARYALERIPGAEVDDVLLGAMSKTSGNIQIGIVNTLGQRKVTQAVPALGKLLNSRDEGVVMAAASALGNIANPEATELLANATNKQKGKVRSVLVDAYLRCADRLAAEGDVSTAVKIYQGLYRAKEVPQIKAAALIGLIRSDAANADDYILKSLTKDPSEVKQVAIGQVKTAPLSDLSQIAKALPNLKPIHKVQLLTAFADRGDASVHDVVIAATKDKTEQVRVAALKALASLGNASDIQILADAATKIGDEAEAAQQSLYLLRGDQVNDTILTSIPKAEPRVKVELINSLGQRSVSGVESVLLNTAKEPDIRVQEASVKVLGDLADPQYLPELINLLENSNSETVRDQAVLSVTSVAKKIQDENKRDDMILAETEGITNTQTKSALLRVLGKIGTQSSLPVLRSALKDPNKEVQTAAIRALSDWPTTDVMFDLLEVAKSSADKIHQVLALRGFIGQIQLGSSRPTIETIYWYKLAMSLASEVNEKRMVISGISDIRTLDALDVAVWYLNDSQIKSEAEAAVVRIADRIRRSNPDEAKQALKKVISTTASESRRKDAQRALNRIK